MTDLDLLDVYETDQSCVSGSLIGSNPDGSIIKIIPMYCQRWSCPHCSKFKAVRWRKMAIAGDPDRFLTLTLREDTRLSTSYQAGIIKKAFPMLVKRIRKEFGSFEYLMIFELTKKGTPHVHVLTRGSFIPKQWLSREWNDLTGSFIIGIRKISSPAEVGNYVTKYMGKCLAETASALPGQRIIQRSKNYVLRPIEDPDDDMQEGNGIELSWSFCTYFPREALVRLQEVFGWRLQPSNSATEVILRGPPDEDIVDKLLYPLRHDK